MPPPLRPAAFFDLDHTVLIHTSMGLWVRYEHRRGRMSLGEMTALGWWLLLFRLKLLDMETVVRRWTEGVRGQSEAEMIAECDRWYREVVAPVIAPKARERVRQHLAQGHVVALLTASTVYVARPVAADLGLGDNYVATQLEVVDGVFTGRCVEPICYGQGKLYWARLFADRYGLDLPASHFYTDGYVDLPVLEAVGHPVAVNPDKKLRRIAAERGWPIECFY